MKSLRELIEKATPYPMTEQELADAERRLYRFFRLLYEINQNREAQDANR